MGNLTYVIIWKQTHTNLVQSQCLPSCQTSTPEGDTPGTMTLWLVLWSSLWCIIVLGDVCPEITLGQGQADNKINCGTCYSLCTVVSRVFHFCEMNKKHSQECVLYPWTKHSTYYELLSCQKDTFYGARYVHSTLTLRNRVTWVREAYSRSRLLKNLLDVHSVATNYKQVMLWCNLELHTDRHRRLKCIQSRHYQN